MRFGRRKDDAIVHIDWGYMGALLAQSDSVEQVKFFKAFVKECNSCGTHFQSGLKIAREYFPDKGEEFIECVIWEKTGYPSFWLIPEDGKTPEECFRKQLAEAAKEYYWENP